MANSVTLVVGDTTPDLVAALSNASGAQDLTNATVQMNLRSRGGTVTTLPCTVDSPPTKGVVRHVWQPGETDTPGDYNLWFLVTYFTGQKQSFPNTGKLTVTIARPSF